jgi:hypothetical protein
MNTESEKAVEAPTKKGEAKAKKSSNSSKKERRSSLNVSKKNLEESASALSVGENAVASTEESVLSPPASPSKPKKSGATSSSSSSPGKSPKKGGKKSLTSPKKSLTSPKKGKKAAAPENLDAEMIVALLTGDDLWSTEAEVVTRVSHRAFDSLYEFVVASEEKDYQLNRQLALRPGAPLVICRQLKVLGSKDDALLASGLLLLRCLGSLAAGTPAWFGIIKVGGLERACWTLQNHTDVALQLHAVAVLGDMVLDETITDLFVATGGVDALIYSLKTFAENPNMLKKTLEAIRQLCRRDGSSAVVERGAVDLVVQLMQERAKDPDMQKRGCYILLALGLEQKKAIKEAGGLAAVSKIFSIHRCENDLLKVAHETMNTLAR